LLQIDEGCMTDSAPSFGRHLWRWTKRLARVTTGLVVVALAAAGLGVPAVSRTAWARGRMEKTLTHSLGAPVQVGAMEWTWRKGLVLQEVAASADAASTSFRIDRIQILPRLVKLAEGKLRFRATLENPELRVIDAGAALPVPKLPRKDVRIDQIDFVNAAISVKSGDETARVEGLTIRGSGRVEDRVLRIDLASLSGHCEGAPFTGQGSLRLSRDGFSGRISMNEAAAKESPGLQKVFRGLHLEPAKPPVLSEPF
jgi:hypothetical protein